MGYVINLLLHITYIDNIYTYNYIITLHWVYMYSLYIKYIVYIILWVI